MGQELNGSLGSWVTLSDPFPALHITHFKIKQILSDEDGPLKVNLLITRMWANAQRDGRPVEYRLRPLLNAAKFG